MGAAVFLSVFVLGLRLIITSAIPVDGGVHVRKLVQTSLRHTKENVIAKSRDRNLVDAEYDDNPYIYYDNYVEGGTPIINQAQAEMEKLYESPPSEWGMTEWEIFSSIFAFSLAILICCTVCLIRCCSIESDNNYKAFDDRTQYSSDGSMAGVISRSTRSRQVIISSPSSSGSRSCSNSTKESMLSYDSTLSGVSDKITRQRS